MLFEEELEELGCSEKDLFNEYLRTLGLQSCTLKVNFETKIVCTVYCSFGIYKNISSIFRLHPKKSVCLVY